jgi:malic enzyme
MSIQGSVYNKVIFCDKNVKKDDDINLVSALTVAKKVSSIQEMATSLEGSNNHDHKNYNFVMVCGHAVAGMQGLGSGRSANYNPGKDFTFDNLNDIDTQLDTISNSLDTAQAVKPVFFLGGCEAGEGEAGSLLLKRVSNKLQNVLVVASQDHLTFKQKIIAKKLASVTVMKLVNGRQKSEAPEFKFAFNGKIISANSLSQKAGVDQEVLFQELRELSNSV